MSAWKVGGALQAAGIDGRSLMRSPQSELAHLRSFCSVAAEPGSGSHLWKSVALKPKSFHALMHQRVGSCTARIATEAGPKKISFKRRQTAWSTVWHSDMSSFCRYLLVGSRNWLQLLYTQDKLRSKDCVLISAFRGTFGWRQGLLQQTCRTWISGSLNTG